MSETSVESRFKLWWTRHGGLVNVLIRRFFSESFLARTSASADDAAQDVALKLYLAMRDSKVVDESHFEALVRLHTKYWLIGRLRFLERHSGSGRISSVTDIGKDDAWLAESLPRYFSPETSVRFREIITDTLSERERQVVLSLARGKPDETIAKEMGVTESTVRSLRRHALARLVQALEL